MFFAKTEALQSTLSIYNVLEVIFDKNRNLKAKDVAIPLIAQKNLFMTALILKKENIGSDLLNMNSMVRDIKQITQTNEDERYDLLLSNISKKIAHYDKHHKYMTLNQAYTSKLKIKENYT